ncbi:hypothetical protein [Burkholderia vietnamiensis]|uniref:hypothetical protein n=1 Tax=Burkholderia vietnamiensis TaxID=60552 RepID=UPI001CF42E2B|nr:hypothetical protein [Burkholderia vietnamiensis]MCA8073155.1 hypothetical protein [Burkholderia vietnamiensis]
MKEPILSPEEVEALAHRICARYIHSENIHLRQYTFGITTLEQLVDAILEKLCGEPIYQARQLSDEPDRWDDVYADTHSACASQPQFYDTRIVYALNRSKA